MEEEMPEDQFDGDQDLFFEFGDEEIRTLPPEAVESE